MEDDDDTPWERAERARLEDAYFRSESKRLDQLEREREARAGKPPTADEEREWREQQHDLYGAGPHNPREDG